jgi:rare lipoprotein A
VKVFTRSAIASFCVAVAQTLSAASDVHANECVASWYGRESGPRTASGERFNPDGLTAAHRTLPFGTFVNVTNLVNSRTVRVRINDRGPAKWTGKCIDLAHGAARAIGMSGIARVKLEY